MIVATIRSNFRANLADQRAVRSAVHGTGRSPCKLGQIAPCPSGPLTAPTPKTLTWEAGDRLAMGDRHGLTGCHVDAAVHPGGICRQPNEKRPRRATETYLVSIAASTTTAIAICKIRFIWKSLSRVFVSSAIRIVTGVNSYAGRSFIRSSFRYQRFSDSHLGSDCHLLRSPMARRRWSPFRKWLHNGMGITLTGTRAISLSRTRSGTVQANVR